MLKDLIIASLFFLGVLVSFLLGYGMNADYENTNVISILLATGILFGSVFVVLYKGIKDEWTR